MGFFKSLERRVFRPIGRGLKQAAPVLGGVAGSFIPGVGNVVGSAIGSAIGGQLKKGRFDGGSLLRDAGMGVLTGGVMNKLGGGSFLRGAGRGASAASGLKPTDMKNMIGVTGMSGMAPVGNALAQDIGAQAAGSGFRAGLGNMLRDGKTIKAIGDTALGGYQAVQQERIMRQQREQMERNNRLEDEERARREALDPVRAQLLAAMFQRLGLGGAA